MALVTTKAIVFNAIKFGDSSLIVKCFTEKEGVKSYLIRGVLKSKKGKLKVAYFQPLTQLVLTANHNTKGTLNSIKEASVTYHYQNIYANIVKQTMVLFLSEVLATIIKEEEENIALFSYLETAIIWLDTHTTIANFHLLFLLNLSHFLGFYPDISDQDKRGFHLLEGIFTNAMHQKEIIKNDELVQFKKLLGTNFDAIENVSFNKKERQTVLRVILQYFELHLGGFRTPKSLAILETVFS